MANKASTFKDRERVALGEDPNCRGYIYSTVLPYHSTDVTLHNVQWDKNGCFLYLPEALITEKEAIEILAKREAEKNLTPAPGDKTIADLARDIAAAKFKSMEQGASK